ncbi:hypothetical protein MELA_02014 [Candidatus Methylomirabilis lanthanidiphila]|uniref:Uncharacterized protein n=1 Tax=Candidatus Methylomirabilis lanthanidiphila TaxID=2211376 RepID=A0A564ZJW4_9BACT|nr:hypothetical protein MELA_02014 [Candidatus Methylomirabilis lanthanidiphila]
MLTLDTDGIIWAVVVGVLVIGYGLWWVIFRNISRK